MPLKKVIGWIIAISLLIILLFPSINTVQKIEYNDSYRGYGQATYFNWSRRLFYGIDYYGNIYFLHFGDSWKEGKIVEAPEVIGGDFSTSYLSDSVVFVGSDNGKIYYADPETNKVINIIDLNRLHLYFNNTNNPNTFYRYYILWGNKSGYLYVFFNNTIYHIYRDAKIIHRYHYNFTGYLVSAHLWKGGFVLKFGEKPKPWLHKSYDYNVYYAKNGKILWNITLPSRMYKWQSDAPDVYIYHDFVYHFKYYQITIYKDGVKIKNLSVEGDIVSLKRVGDMLYVFTYYGNQNILLVYNKNLTLVKRVPLFNMKEIGVEKYDIINQKVSMYQNSIEFAIFLYTCSLSNDGSPYLPIRIVYLDKNMNIVWKTWYGKFYRAINVYPLWKRNEIVMVTSEFSDLYFVTLGSTLKINPFSWINVKIFLIIIILLSYGYTYSKKQELKMKLKNI